MRRLTVGLCLMAALACWGCSDDNGAADEEADTGSLADQDAGNTGDGGSDDTADVGERRAKLVHNFGDVTLEPGEETLPCTQWTLDNEEALYVDIVEMANEGGFHHSNWYIVPEDEFEGEDGYFGCDERGLNELEAALSGSVLFAQSTQARHELQDLREGVVVKIPPRHKVVGFLHLLNAAPRELETSMSMGFDLIHPRDVDDVVTPFAFTYYPLDIPPNSEARFTGECDDMASKYEAATGEEFDIELFWVLPHYHGLGNYFGLEVAGGERDGEMLFELSGFDAEAHGEAFDDPIDMTGAEGFNFTCGYDNPTDETVGWGIGDQEMCMMLGFADSKAIMNSEVNENEVGETKDGIVQNSGHCETLAIEEGEAHKMPSEEEFDEPLYVPPSDGEADDLDPASKCEDTPEDAEAGFEATLEEIDRQIFEPGCTFSACHGSGSSAGGLDLSADDLHETLLDHQVRAPTEMALVEPGKPEESWLYEIVSKCDPEAGGNEVAHMPRNSPTLLDPELVATLRDWIEEGAEDN